MDKSEEIKARAARYKRVERVDDAWGRVIGVRRLKPSQRVRIEEMCPGLYGNTTITADDGSSFQLPRIAPMIMAAHVVEIDGDPWPFPQNRADLDLLFDTLDGEGLSAVREALVKMEEADNPPDDQKPDQSVEEMAKN